MWEEGNISYILGEWVKWRKNNNWEQEKKQKRQQGCWIGDNKKKREGELTRMEEKGERRQEMRARI